MLFSSKLQHLVCSNRSALFSLLSSVPLIIKFFAVFVFFEFMDSKKTNKALLFCRAVSSHCFTDLNTKPDF